MSNDNIQLQDSSEYDGGPFGPEVPNEVLFTAKLLSDATAIIAEPELRALCGLCYDYVSRKHFSRCRYLELKRSVLDQWKQSQLMAQLGLSKSDFDRLFAGLLKITECIGRNFRMYTEKSSPAQLKKDVAKYSRLSEELTELIFDRFVDSPSQAPKFLIVNNWAATGNRLISVRWRIDVVISDRFLAKIMEPVVRFELVYSNGGVGARKVAKFECRMAQFHRLRFITTCLLKEMGYLETRVSNMVK